MSIYRAISLLFLVFSYGLATTYNSDPIQQTEKRCPESYCGKIKYFNTSYSKCGPCPRLYESTDGVCTKCTSSPTTYDYMYFIFMALLLPVLSAVSIDKWGDVRGIKVTILYICVVIETVLSAIITLLLFTPKWKLNLLVCNGKKVKDFYAIFSSRAKYEGKTIYCNYEVVYPRYTIILTYYAISVLILLIFRPAVSKIIGSCSRPTYASLFIAPSLIIIHSLLAGVIYYTFPYILAVLAVVFNAIHLSSYPVQTWKKLIVDSIKPRNLILILADSSLLAFSVCAITELTDFKTHLPFLLLAPLPAVLYILTAPLTDLSDID